MVVVGVDGCKDGWIAVALGPDDTARGRFLASIGELEDWDGVAGVAIDIPIGLADATVRACDLAARAALGPRRASVFMTPPRTAIEAASQAEASAVSRALTGAGVSAQAYALRRKVLEADAWSRTTTVPHWEVHPELAFAQLLGAPAQHPKRTWAGQQERRAALQDAGIDLDHIGEAGARAAADDVLDAVAAAWSARRLVAGEGSSWPEQPERYPGWPHPVAIWA